MDFNFKELKRILQLTNPDKEVTDEQVRQVGSFLLKLYSVVV